jgi:asparagine synthase (glutamine-hydrolysing)
MYYVALIWDRADVTRTQAALRMLRDFESASPGWKTVFNQPGLAVCCKTRGESRLDCVYDLQDGRGIVLGKLFRKHESDFRGPDDLVSSPVPAETDATTIVQNSGDGLVQHYWGRYAAFLHDPATGCTCVLRDPSGGMHCQWTSTSGVDVYFVRVDDALRLAGMKFSIDLSHVATYLLLSAVDPRRTPFCEVQTVLPGERIKHAAANRTHEFAWNPIAIAQNDVIEDEVVAVQRMRQTVRQCVHAWASCFDGIWHSLSGGLDSSIVAACLADAPSKPRVTCHNFFLDGPNSDERVFARQVAKRAGFELIEHEVRTQFRPQFMQSTARSLVPVCWPSDREADAAEDRRLLQNGYTAEFRGHGGDELFFRGGSIPVAVDYAWRHGLDRNVLSYALNDAALMHSSVWSILGLAYRYGVRRKRWSLAYTHPSDHMSLMSAALRKEVRKKDPYLHPLFENCVSVPPGKLEHAFLLTYGTFSVFDPLLPDEAPARLSPLISQPLTELSLRIPIYTHQVGGRDRAIARRAFQQDLPADVINRKSKAYGTQRYRAIVEQNIDLVRSMLLDGFLVQQKILDRVKVEEALSPRVSRSPAEVLEICDYMSVEAWARGWDMVPRVTGQRAPDLHSGTPLQPTTPVPVHLSGSG